MNGFLRLTCMAILLAGGSYVLRPGGGSTALGDLRFEECSGQAGLAHTHTLCHLSSRFDNIMPWLTSVGAAVAVADVDGDGRMDVYLTSSGRGDTNRLFRNRGDGTFEDITIPSGTGVGNPEGASMAAVFGDIDNDGDPDLYVVMWGAKNRLFENLGQGRFRDVTGEASVGFRGYGNGATFLDYDRDGLLDLLVGNYFAEALPDPGTGTLRPNDLWNPFTTKVMHESFTHAKNGGRNVLYRNLGGNRFEDVTERAGLTYTGWTLAVGSADLDNDGWPDLYIANDFGADEVYFSTGASETPPRFLPFVGKQGHPAIGDDWWKGMNVELGDVDGNGFVDVYVTNVLAPRYKTDEGNMLWLNLPDPLSPHGRRFVNVGRKTGTHDGGWGWGAKLADFNNDGLLDILAANGFVTGSDPGRTYWYDLQEMVTQLKNATSDAADWPVMGDRDLSGHETNRLWLQLPPAGGDLRFEEAAVRAGITDIANGRGVALLDADDDGDLDLYIANQGQPGCFYRNQLYQPGRRAGTHWLGLALVGDAAGAGVGDAAASSGVAGRRFASTRDAVGARVILDSGGKTQTRVVSSGLGFAAQSDPRLFFGLGESADPSSIEIHWPSGSVQRIDHNAARGLVDRMTRVVEGGPPGAAQAVASGVAAGVAP